MKKFMSKDKKVYYFNSKEGISPFEFSKTFSKLLEKYDYESTQLVFLCIGSDRATGDSLGPIIGFKLSTMNYKNCSIYGTLDQPVHAKNLAETIQEIKRVHIDPVIIAIDASLGTSNHIGFVTLGEGSLHPGSGVNKELPEVGDIFITGIVNLSGIFDHMVLQTTRLNIVMKLADCICLGIRFSILSLERGVINQSKRGFLNKSGVPAGSVARLREIN